MSRVCSNLRTCWSRRVQAVVASLVLAAVFAPWSGAARPLRPDALVLAAADIPGKTTRLDVQVLWNASIAKGTVITPTQLAKWGRITGYQSEFLTGGSTSAIND